MSDLHDIENRDDCERLVRAFYSRALTDPLIGWIFTDVAKLDLEHHLPIIGDFWESLLFGTPTYQKHGRNPMLVHKDLHEKSELVLQHFERWLEIFTKTVDDLFEGENAEHLKMRAGAIAERFVQFLDVRPAKPVEIGSADQGHR